MESDTDKAIKDDYEKRFGFRPQKIVIYNRLLPHANVISDEAVTQLKDIKENLAKAVILRDIRPSCIYWVSKFLRYIKIYGLCFSKEDHILFVKLAYELVTIPDQEFWVTGKFAETLNTLLKKRELLSPDDLKLPWKPLYDIYHKLFLSSTKSVGLIPLPQNAEMLFKSTIRLCRPYFPIEATAEIMELWRPQFCPYDAAMCRAISCIELFLPTMLSPDKSQFGWKLWFDEILKLWNSFHNEPMWGSTVFCLLARLAWQNIGQIPWENHISLVFTRILWQFHLPVNYKKVNIYARKGLDTWAVSMFIVSNLGGGSSTQTHLSHLFNSLESYFHPSNVGVWTRILNDFQMKLTNYFIQRLHNERYKDPSWVTPTEDCKKLTEEDITAFVKCLQPAANLSVFSKTGSYEAGIVLHRLALLRPEIVIPPVLDQLYSALETMTEPHRLIAALQCVVRVSRPLVLGGRRLMDNDLRYEIGPTHVIPLLINSLPGIDPNDITKCMVTFQFIATFISLIPVIDCSSAIEEIEDLSEMEQQLCLQTAEFEDFVLQFISRSFSLIESSALEQTTQHDREHEAMNLEENMVEIGLSSAFKAILAQAHPKIFDTALEHLLSFTKGRCLETKVAGKFIATMCRSAAKANSEKTLRAFLPSVCKLILTLTEHEEVFEDEKLDDELLFNMLLLSELVQSKGRFLLEYIPQVSKVLHRTLHLKSRKGYRMASSILRNVLWSLNLTVPAETKSVVAPWDSDFKDFLPIRHWGVAGDIDNLGIEWNEPGEAEEKATTFLIREFLTPELIIMKKVADGDSSISRDRLHQGLNITQDILYAGAAFPMWDEEPMNLVEMKVNRDLKVLTARTQTLKATLNSSEFPTNVRLAIINTTLDLVQTLLDTESDDTKALNYASNIYYNISFFFGVKKEESDSRWKSFVRVKQALSDSVVRKKQHVRTLLIERTVLQYEIRILESSIPIFTPTHQRMLYSLFSMSTSHYSEVRKKAQSVLTQFFRQFPYSYKLILPKLVETLKKDSTIFHKEIKGALYVIHGSKEKSLIVRRDWDSLNLLLPALISSQHSEKPSIVKLCDSILKTFCRYFELFAIELQVPEPAVTIAKELLSSSFPAVINPLVDPTMESMCSDELKVRSQKNLEGYQSLVHNLVLLFNTGNLHWRKSQICLSMLGVLVRPDVPFPAEGVKVVTSCLINDNIILRKVSICSLPPILKNQKRIHKKIKMNPYKVDGDHPIPDKIMPGDNRPDNRWMQYKKESLNLNEESFNNKIFVHKTWKGWYCWANELEVYAPPSEQPPINRPYSELSEEEKVLYDFFNNQENVDKLIGFLSLEEHKGFDKFCIRRYHLFKGLFRNFGDYFLPLFEPHLKRLVADSQESSQRCAAEIIAGVMRGSKHWPYKNSKYALDLTCSLLRVVFTKVLNETIEDWGSCLMNISVDRDPNRMAPIIEMLMEDLVRQEEGSFLATSRLFLCQLFFEQQEWRIAESYQRLYESLEPHLASPFKSIRDRIGVFLYRIFMRDETFTGDSSTLSPHQADFVEYLLPRLSILIKESGNGGGISTADLSPSDHPSIKPVGVNSDILATSLEITSVGSSLLNSEFDDSSRSSSMKDLQEASYSPTGPIDPLFIGKLYSNGELKAPISTVLANFTGNGFQPGDSEERKVALRLMNTVCKYLTCIANYVNSSIPLEIYSFLPHLCQLESIDTDQELRSNCVSALAYLSRVLILPKNINSVILIIKSICENGMWRARIAALSFLQVMIFNNMFTIIELDNVQEVQKIIFSSLSDSRAEVRKMSSQVLSGSFHCNFIPADKHLLDEFTQKLNGRKRTRDPKTGRLLPLTTESITERHFGALGLSAFISAHPYDVPEFMPESLITLSEHINDPQPIANDIKQILSDFRRTHHDNWQDHKKNFTGEQLAILTDVLVSPSYYA